MGEAEPARGVGVPQEGVGVEVDRGIKYCPHPPQLFPLPLDHTPMVYVTQGVLDTDAVEVTDWVGTALGEGAQLVEETVVEGEKGEVRVRVTDRVRDTVFVTLRVRVGLGVPEPVLAFVQVRVGVLTSLPLGESLEEAEGECEEDGQAEEERAVALEEGVEKALGEPVGKGEEVVQTEVEGVREGEGEEEGESDSVAPACSPLLIIIRFCCCCS